MVSNVLQLYKEMSMIKGDRARRVVMCLDAGGDTEARRASPETCLEARVMVALIQQTAEAMDQLESSETEAESRVQRRLVMEMKREGRLCNGKIGFMAGLILKLC